MFSVLLRGFLSLSLILNGSGYAVASMQTNMGHTGSMAASQAVALQPGAAAESPCHSKQHNASAVVSIEVRDAVQDHSAAKDGSGSLDCCKSGSCQCACVHQIQAAIPASILLHDMPEHASGVHSLKPGHASPPLPHLIRPPIG